MDLSHVLDLSKHADAQLYVAFLMDRARECFNLEKLHPCVTAIGLGATSLVFTHEQHDDCVIQVAYASWDHSNERRLLRELAGAGDMLRLHSCSSCTRVVLCIVMCGRQTSRKLLEDPACGFGLSWCCPSH